MTKLIKLEIDPYDLPYIRVAILGRAQNILDYIDLCIEDYVNEPDEIKDVAIDNFKSDIEEMIEKHQPKKVGRPKGSKNAK